MRRIVLHIDRLVLRGVAPCERDALLAALTETLRRELPGVGMQQWAEGARYSLKPSPIVLPGNNPGEHDDARSLGRELALRLMEALQR